MRYFVIPIGMIMLLVTACSDNKGGQPQSTAAPAAPAMTKKMSADTGPADSVLGSGVIDHTRDKKEFVLRRSLWGVESLIEQYKAAGDDTTALEAQRAELQAELKKLLG